MFYRDILECRRTFSQDDIRSFVTTTGDSNPIHTDCKAAKASSRALAHFHHDAVLFLLASSGSDTSACIRCSAVLCRLSGACVTWCALRLTVPGPDRIQFPWSHLPFPDPEISQASSGTMPPLRACMFLPCNLHACPVPLSLRLAA